MRQKFKKNKTLIIFFSPTFTYSQLNQETMQKQLPIFFLFFLLFGCNNAKRADQEFFSSQETEATTETDSLLNLGEQTIQKVTASQMAQMLSLDKAYLFDSRTVEEYNEKRIGNSIHVDLDQLDSAKEKCKELDLRRTFYIYGNNEGKVQKFGKLLIELGVNQVYILDGGFQAWEEAQLPTIH
jgi:rhodanese-related sulfurtransferase